MLILSHKIFLKHNEERFVNTELLMKKIRILEHTADIAVEVFAGDIEHLFIFAAEAWLTAVADTEKATSDEERDIMLSSSSLEVLLVDFLSELNYLLNTKKWIYLDTEKISIKQNGKFTLIAKVKGTKLNENNVKLKNEIKAITFHQMNIEKIENGFITKIIFDI